MTVADAFAQAVALAIEQQRDDVLERLLTGMAEIAPAVRPPSDSEVVE